MTQELNRREFLGAAAAGVAVASLAPLAVAAPNPTGTLKLGLIGCGWYGMVDVEAALKVGGVEIVALCDVDREHLRESAEKLEERQGKRPLTFARYEDLLKVAGMDAVIIATPPHWHALMFLAALRRGLDIYCEKPLAYDVREGQAMVKAARASRSVVQVGFQRRQSPAVQQVRDYIRSGKAGRIVQAEAQIFYKAGLRDTNTQEPPASLDWDAWCGPAPKLPYCPNIGHFAWRLEKAYGHGHLVDWGIHLLDAARWILGEGMPTTVQAAGGLYYFKGKITTPDILTVQYDFGTCPLTWRHRIWGATEYTPEVQNGILFYGENETVFVTDDRWVTLSKEKAEPKKVVEVKADLGTNHMANFLECVRTRRTPICPPEDAFQSTATAQLGAIAYEAGVRFNWDEKTGTIPDQPKARDLLKRPYRSPYRHPHTSLGS